MPASMTGPGQACGGRALQDWARGGRRFTMLACSYDDVIRHARFVRWRGTWDHIITCRRSPAADPLDLPSALWSPQWVLHRLDPEAALRGGNRQRADRRVLLHRTLNSGCAAGCAWISPPRCCSFAPFWERPLTGRHAVAPRDTAQSQAGVKLSSSVSGID